MRSVITDTQNAAASLEKPSLTDGTYRLTDENIRPMPSVVYDVPGHRFQIQVLNGENPTTVVIPFDIATIETTNGTRAVIVSNGKFTINLHKDDEISEITSTQQGSSGFTKGVLIGVLMHALLR